MCALISPTCSLTSDSSACSPERMRARVSRTHVGQSESVVRGQPSCGVVRSVLLSSGAAAHFGWNGLAVEPPVDRLESGPQEPRPARQRQLKRSPRIHSTSRKYNTPSSSEDDARTRSSSAARSTLPRGRHRQRVRRTRCVRGILCDARRALQNRRTSSTLTCRGRIGDDARDDLLAAARIGRREDPDVARRRASSRSTCSTSSGCTFRPATLTNDETRPTQRQALPSVPRAVVAGEKSAVDEAVTRPVGVAVGDRVAPHMDAAGAVRIA